MLSRKVAVHRVSRYAEAERVWGRRNRFYAIRDSDCKFGSGKIFEDYVRIDRLVELASTYDEDALVVRFPGVVSLNVL